MAINSPRIAGPPAIERRRVVEHQPLSVRPEAPSKAYIGLDSGGSPILVQAVTPDREGQLVVYSFVDDTGLNRRAQIYVAVDIDGTLTWKVAAGQTLLNRWTGKPYDPMFDG